MIAIEEPRVIANRIHAVIAARSPGCAALVAAYQAIPPGGRKPAAMRAVEEWKRKHRAGIEEARS